MSSIKATMLYICVLICGACVMVFELVAPRLYAPFFGTSTYIWTIVIGVVMASLSLGYFLGGKLADAKPKVSTLSSLFLVAGILAYATYVSKDVVIHAVLMDKLDIVLSAFKASIVILAPVNVVLGMVTPVVVRIMTKNTKSSGRSSGNVYAVSTVGSIAGTFAAGFYLIPTFGVHTIFLGVSLALLLCAAISTVSGYIRVLSFILFVCFFVLTYLYSPQETFARYFEATRRATIVAELDTQYNRVWIFDTYLADWRIMRVLSNSQSKMYLDQPIEEVVSSGKSYFSLFELGTAYLVNVKDVLVLGGGAYTYPHYLLSRYPDMHVDVVEIDPDYLWIAKKYFDFDPSDNFNNYAMDGRVFLNTNKRKYDVIYSDVNQNGNVIPFHLATKEAYQRMRDSLQEDGILFVNVIGSLEGNAYFKSQYDTMRSVFDNVKIFPVHSGDPTLKQNIVLIAFKNDNALEVSEKEKKAYMHLFAHETQYSPQPVEKRLVLTDDYAPVEYYDFVRTF